MKILVVAKHSKLEWDCKTRNQSPDAVAAEYITSGANYDAIMESHHHQVKVRGWFKKHIPGTVVMLEQYKQVIQTIPASKEGDLVISLGGDNSFTSVAQTLYTTPILGVTIDPLRSMGALNSFAVDHEHDVMELAERLEQNKFSIETWPRIRVAKNGSILPLATSEIFIGERLRKNMSRYVINGKEYKTSGLIVYTGAGSTGWALAAGIRSAYPKTVPWLHYIHTEGFKVPGEYDNRLLKEDTLTVTSLCDDGIVSADCWEDHPFNRGATLTIGYGDPLNVVRFN